MRSIALATFVFGASLPCFAQDKLPGFDSPEKAFHAYLNGAVSQDFSLTLSSLTPEAKRTTSVWLCSQLLSSLTWTPK